MLKSAKFSVKVLRGLLQTPIPTLFRPTGVKSVHFLKDKFPPKTVELLPEAKYGGVNIVTLLTGASSIGEQGAKFVRALIETTSVPVAFERIDLSSAPLEYVNSVKRNRSALHVDIHYLPEEKQKVLVLNNELDLYACITRMQSFEGFNCRHNKVDILLIIQNIVGDYAKLEYQPVPGVVETLKFVEAGCTERYIRFVFNYAKRHCRKKITLGHKEQELPRTDGMFLDIAHKVYKEHPDIELEIMDIDRLILKLIMNPCDFDTICTGDRYGTIVASISSAVCGGPSLFSVTELSDHHAVFKPLQTKLSISDIQTLSPYGIVRACIDLLSHLGNHECAKIMWDELMVTMLKNKVKTKEFGGNDSCEFVICDIVNRLKCK